MYTACFTYYTFRNRNKEYSMNLIKPRNELQTFSFATPYTNQSSVLQIDVCMGCGRGYYVFISYNEHTNISPQAR